jgi:hypothetical protein
MDWVSLENCASYSDSEMRYVMSQEMKRIAWFALYGAIGFGIGGLIFMTVITQGESLALSFSAPAVMGAIGGAALGLASRDWKIVLILTLLGAIGFLTGATIALLSGSFTWEILGDIGFAFFFCAMMGAIGGAVLALPSLNWRRIIGLAFAGALGFGTGIIMLIMPINGFLQMCLWGVFGGAVMGAALGYLEREKAETSNQCE